MSSQTTLSELKESVSNFLAQPEIYELVRVPSSDEAQIEHFKQTGAWMDEAMTDKGSEGKAVRKLVHLRLEKYLNDALHDELHWLATGGHRILQAEAERRKSGRP